MRTCGNTILKGSTPLVSLTDAYHHAPAMIARYQLASQYVTGKQICDIACGAGYGSFFLSQIARQVVGLDISQETIFWARKHFRRSNLSFFQGDGTKSWPVHQSFEVIVSFETMEHTTSPQRFLEHIYKHLKPGGTLILSVPNGPRDRVRHDNPYHRFHFTAGQLKDLMESYFNQSQYFSQCYNKGVQHYLVKPFRKCMKYNSQIAQNYFFTSGLDSGIKTWIVIAKKKAERLG